MWCTYLLRIHRILSSENYERRKWFLNPFFVNKVFFFNPRAQIQPATCLRAIDVSMATASSVDHPKMADAETTATVSAMRAAPPFLE